MKQYKYSITMQFNNGNNNTPISSEHISRLLVDSDYEHYNMPMFLATLNIDKNLADSIITNAKTSTMTLTIYKFVENIDSAVNELYIQGEFNYIIQDDINYNKDIDYAGDNANKTDIYKELYIGLVCKSSIDNNKKVANDTIKDTTMINAIALYTKHMPMLIEPFTYNETLNQVAVPPLDSVAKTIKFFNNIKVFYDTPYRFFIDPDCGYLISSSGKGIQKQNELYSTVMIHLHAINDMAGNTVGMMEDSTNKYYYTDMNVVDSHYTIDNDSTKIFNKIAAVINSSKANSTSPLSTLSKCISDVKGIFTNINSTITNKMSLISSIPASLNTFKLNFLTNTDIVNTNVSTILTLAQSGITEINSIPEAPVTNPDGTVSASMSAATKITIIAYINTCIANIKASNISLQTLNTNYLTTANATLSSFTYVTTIPSFVNGISAINMKDNLTTMQQVSTKIKNLASQNKTNIANLVSPKSLESGVITKNVSNMISTFQNCGATSTVLVAVISGLQSCNTTVANAGNSITADISSYVAMPDNLTTINNAIKPYLNLLSNISTDLKAQVANVATDIKTLGNTAKSLISSITSLGNGSDMKGISLGSLSSIKSDLNTIKDISSIGKLGISTFDAALNIGDSSNDKTKVICITNDNANMIKNLKAQKENSINKLTINKNDLDASVFTINKEYIIKNYDAHSDKDGNFLLMRKVLIFLRQDANFVCNTMLELNKIAATTTSSNSTKM